MNKLLVVAVLLFIVCSCKKDRPESPAIVSQINGERGVYIGSEGNYQFGNASLSYYDINSKEISSKVYENANGFKVGDVLQSIHHKGSTLYLVVNNSGKVELVDQFTFKSTGSITGFSSPRYFLPVSNSKAYVTDLYGGSIAVVDLNTLEIVKSIQVNGWTEELKMIYGKVFVCNKGNDQVYVIDTATDLLEDSITVSDAPTSIVEDKKGMLWVLCKNGLHKIDPIRLSLLKSFAINTSVGASQLKLNGGKDTLYYLNNGVFQFSIGESTMPESPIIEPESRNFYGLGVDLVSGDIYVSDAIDYLQKSKVFVYTSSGVIKNSFISGVNTSFFHF